ncbi:MAG: glycosyltransferase family 4 protein, partial [Bacteroidales bacterium]
VWVDAMHQDQQEKMWRLLAEKAKDVDAFIAVSSFFAGVMQKRMAIPNEKLHVLHVGVRPDFYPYTKPAINPQIIGYLSRLNDENGFEILIDAFIKLKENPAFGTLKLKATGGMTGDDTKFINKQINKLKQKNILVDFEIQEDFTSSALQEFFKSITVLSVPVLKGEAFGLYQIEALASGVPLVQPELGAFPEIITATGGGVTYQPNTASALAEKLAEVLTNPAKLEVMSLAGRKSVEEKFDCGVLSQKMVEIYKTL